MAAINLLELLILLTLIGETETERLANPLREKLEVERNNAIHNIRQSVRLNEDIIVVSCFFLMFFLIFFM